MQIWLAKKIASLQTIYYNVFIIGYVIIIVFNFFIALKAGLVVNMIDLSDHVLIPSPNH